MKQDVSSASRPLDGVATVLVIALCLSWGFNQVAIKLALPEIPPLIQAAFRSTFGRSLARGGSPAVVSAVVVMAPAAAAAGRPFRAARERY